MCRTSPPHIFMVGGGSHRLSIVVSEELGVQGAAWWTSLEADPKSVVMLYHDHATMEQHHGELRIH